MPGIGQMQIVLSADAARLYATLDQIAKHLRKTEDQGNKMGRSLASIGDRLAGAFGRIRLAVVGIAAAFTTHRLTRSFLQVSEQVDALGKASKRLGIGVEELSALKFAAGEAGIEFDALSKMVAKAGRTVAELVNKGQVSERVGNVVVRLSDARGEVRSIAELLPELARGIASARSQAEQLRLAERFFGKGGGEQFITLLQESGGFIQNLTVQTERARRLNAIVTQDEVDRLTALNDAIGRIGEAWFGVRKRLLAEVAPALTELANKMASLVAALPEIVRRLALTIRLALLGHQGPSKAIEEWFASLGALAGTGLKSVFEIAFAVIQGGTDAILRMLDARTESWFETLILKVPNWLSIAYQNALKSISPAWDADLFDRRIETLRGELEAIDRNALDQFQSRLSDIALRIKLLQDSIKHWQADPRADIAAMAIRTLRDEITKLEGEQKRLRELSAATRDGVEGAGAAISGPLAAAIRKAREELVGAGSDFLRASDAVLGVTEALAKTSLDGLPNFAKQLQEQIKPLSDLELRIAEFGRQAKDAIRGFAQDAGQAWADLVFDGKAHFDELLKAWGKTLFAMAAKTIVLQPVFDQLGSFVGRITSPSPAGAATRGGGGGAFSAPIPSPNFGSPGSLVGGWVPSPTRAGGISVQINDYRTGGKTPEVSQSRGPDGRQVIRITLRDEVRKMIGDGTLDASMSQAYGLNRRGAPR
jgi:hypothetical protein